MRVLALPPMLEWIRDGAAEPERLEAFEGRFARRESAPLREPASCAADRCAGASRCGVSRSRCAASAMRNSRAGDDTRALHGDTHWRDAFRPQTSGRANPLQCTPWGLRPSSPRHPSAFAQDRESVGDGQHHALHARVARHHRVEGAQRDRVRILRLVLHDVAHPQHVVDEDQSVAPRAQRGSLRSRRRSSVLSASMKARSKTSSFGSAAQRLDRGADLQLDLVRDAGLLPVRAADRGPLLGDVAAEQASVVGQPARGAQRTSSR